MLDIFDLFVLHTQISTMKGKPVYADLDPTFMPQICEKYFVQSFDRSNTSHLSPTVPFTYIGRYN